MTDPTRDAEQAVREALDHLAKWPQTMNRDEFLADVDRLIAAVRAEEREASDQEMAQMIEALTPTIRAAAPVPVARSGEVVAWRKRPEVQDALNAITESVGHRQFEYALPEALHNLCDLVAASPAPSGPPNQARDDIGVDDGPTDGHAVSVHRSAGPSREEVEEAARLLADRWPMLGGDANFALLCADVADALAMYRPAGETPQATVDEDDLCEDCLEQKATEFFETVPNQRCKDCTIKMLDEVCERMRADMPVAPDNPAAVGRVAMLMRDYGADAVDCAKRIVAALTTAAPAGETE